MQSINVSATEAKKSFAAVIRAAEVGGRVLVVRNGTVRAVVIGEVDLQRLEWLDRARQKAEAAAHARLADRHGVEARVAREVPEPSPEAAAELMVHGERELFERLVSGCEVDLAGEYVRARIEKLAAEREAAAAAERESAPFAAPEAASAAELEPASDAECARAFAHPQGEGPSGSSGAW